MSGEPSLSVGDTGEWVVYLQEMLAHNGRPVTIDGAYGRATAEAIAQFQQEHNLLASGETDGATWGELTGETAAAAAYRAED